jgi:hypothetical protein
MMAENFFKEVAKTLVTKENNVLDLIKCQYSKIGEYYVIPASPATGIIYIINDFISGHLRMRGRDNGSYPYRYLEMIDAVFGKAEHTFEACAGNVKSDIHTTTADIRFNSDADIVGDCQNLDNLAINSFDRWRCDPPYNEKAAKEMWNCELPDTMKLLKAGARIIKEGSLMFLLTGPVNYQWHPKGTKRIGMIICSIVPNNELRVCQIYLKLNSVNAGVERRSQ